MHPILCECYVFFSVLSTALIGRHHFVTRMLFNNPILFSEPENPKHCYCKHSYVLWFNPTYRENSIYSSR